MSEANELPQMCFLHEASTSMQTLMTGIYSLKEMEACWSAGSFPKTRASTASVHSCILSFTNNGKFS